MRFLIGGINEYKSEQNGILLITHYQRLLDYIVPDVVHVIMNGRIVLTGDKDLALRLEKEGYDKIREEVNSKESVSA